MTKMKYEDLLKKHGLPPLTAWIAASDEEITIRDVRKALQEKLYGFVDVLDALLHPEGVAAMVEAQVFSEDEHDQMRVFYNRVMLLGKTCQLIDIECTEAEEIALVKKICAEMPSLATEMKRILEKTKEAYNGQNASMSTISYLG